MEEQAEQIKTLVCERCGSTEGCKCASEDSLTPFDPWIGKTINDQYEVVSLIARGGMGAVYRARHKHLGTFRAIKVIRPDVHRDESVYQRFKHEAKAVSGLSHPNIVSFYDYGITESAPYVVMDLIEGESLDALIKRIGKIPIPRALDIFAQVAGAMAHAHSKGVFHRDLKPSNIILQQDENGKDLVKVLDFGIAKVQNSSEEHKLTSTGEIFGSPAYMSPEQGRGGVIDGRSDIYSFACVMYECLTGSVPFKGNSAVEILMKHQSEKPAKIQFSKKDQNPVSHDLEAIIERCLEKDPANRYKSMSLLESDMKQLSYGERLFILQKELTQKRQTELIAKWYKKALIFSFIALFPTAFYVAYVEPKTWRKDLQAALQDPDNADKIIQEIINKLPEGESNYKRNRAFLVLSQAQALRVKSSGDPEKLSLAREKYTEALSYLEKFEKENSGKNVSVTLGIEADIYLGLARAYLEETPQTTESLAKAKVMSLKAIAITSKAIGVNKALDPEDKNIHLAQAIDLFVEIKLAQRDYSDVDTLLSQEEQIIRAWAPDGWMLEDCLEKHAQAFQILGKPERAKQKWNEAVKLTSDLYGEKSKELDRLKAKILKLSETNKN